MGGIKLSKADTEKFGMKLKDMPKFLENMKDFSKRINGNYESLNAAHIQMYDLMTKNFPAKMAIEFW